MGTEKTKGQSLMETNRIFPDNWRDVIKGKKVILYNTGVTSLLQGRERRIEKMKWVFDIFREHPEVVLWWRPHPLEVSTAHSMLPELEEQYLEVRRRYVEEGIGILDESADLNRAIAISDAYYGAFSSVVELYKAAKKPVLYENYKVRKIEEAIFLPAALCVKDDFIWFIQWNSNKLVKVNRDTFEVEKIIIIDGEPPFIHRLYNYHIIDTGNSLLLLLEKSHRIYEYEIETDTVKIHEPNIENFIFHSEAVMKKNDKLFLLPNGDNAVLEYNCETEAVIEKRISGEKTKAAKCYEMIGTKIYMVDSGSNTLYQYDTSDGSCKIRRIGIQENRFWGVKKAGRYFVLPHLEKKAITLWDEESEKVTELTQFPDGYACLEGNAYLDMFEKDGGIYIFPFCANMILKVEVEHEEIAQAFEGTFFNADYDADLEHVSGAMYLCVERYRNSIYAYADYKRCWQVFDMDAMCVQSSPPNEIKKIEHKKMLEDILDDETNEESFCEGERSLISNLKNYIINVNYHGKEGDKETESIRIGSQIYKFLIDESKESNGGAI